MTDSITIYPQKGKTVLYLLASLLLMAAGLFIFVYTEHFQNLAFVRIFLFGSSLLIRIIGGLGFLFFGAAVFKQSKFLLSSKPLLLVNQEGISDYSSPSALGLIPWEDIADVQLTDFSNQQFLSLVLKDEEPYLAKMNWMKKRLAKANQALVSSKADAAAPLIFISLSISKDDPEAIFRQVKDIYANYR
ncbi:STM3941 family protein [Streptococcus pantholopis]|uniref:Uncharacterized protein n=1 Tax=Streptococcus pantholopis TaxID=1811193 RepID=A0A172Q9L4_9STRE|nr:STM3941 family protein [Streptococcus pantholopis]AND80141.1 hypothetical protein A0O21_09075 [Streptococcus pantholopis]